MTNGNLDLSEYSGQVYDPNTGDTADCVGSTANNACGTGRVPFAGNLIPMTNPGLSPVGLNRPAGPGHPRQKSQNESLVGSVHCGRNDQQFFVEPPLQQRCHQLRHQVGLHDHSEGPPERPFQPPEYDHVPGATLRLVPWWAREAEDLKRPESQRPTAPVSTTTIVFSPTLFTEVRVGLAHLRNSAQQTDYGKNDATTLGIPGNGPNGTDKTATSSGQVAFAANVFSSPLIGYSASLPWLRAESNIDFANNWTKIIGNHTLKGGADIRRVRDDLLQGNNNAAAGQFYFEENSTSAPGATAFNGSATGEANDMASILFDVPYKVGQDTNSTFPCYRQTWLFFFASDKWQVGPKLTLDLGLRYELYPPATPRKAGGFVNYNPTNDSLVVAGLDGNPSNLGMQTDYTQLCSSARIVLSRIGTDRSSRRIWH